MSRRASAVPFVWIHGWLGDGGGAKTLREGFGRRAVSAVRLPGYGEGDDPPPDPIASAAQRVSERAGALRAPVLVGHSMGGMIAVEAVRRLGGGVRGLVLLAPVPPGGVRLDVRGWDLFAGAASDPLLLAKVIDYLTAKRLPPRWVGTAVARARRTAPPAALRAYLEGWARRGNGPLPSPVPLDLPVLVLLGRYDRAITPEVAAREILPWFPRAESVLLEECGHFPLAELPLRTLRLIADFAGSLPAP